MTHNWMVTCHSTNFEWFCAWYFKQLLKEHAKFCWSECSSLWQTSDRNWIKEKSLPWLFISEGSVLHCGKAHCSPHAHGGQGAETGGWTTGRDVEQDIYPSQAITVTYMLFLLMLHKFPMMSSNYELINGLVLDEGKALLSNSFRKVLPLDSAWAKG